MPTKNDALGKPFRVEFNGDSYSIPPTEDWDIAVLENFDSGKMTLGIKALLGDDQYAAFRKSNTKIKAFTEFFEAVNVVVDAGK
ncbi:hypothetical protein [Streptomyces sp. SM12]|uniref:hypothetical protein n=1 Tax=Streptomyces sp. SM12 TaxID=1071602 RepID=UPI000CD51F62|nr:hypothetical protein [Streptomyces sp. SM12]